MEPFFVIIDLENKEPVCNGTNGKTKTFKTEMDALYELWVGLLGADGETHIIVEIKL